MGVGKDSLNFGIILTSSLLFAVSASGSGLTPSPEVQKNITVLQESKSCPQCDLSGANLIRMDLSGANLEGANLSRAKLNLADLTGANLRFADLRDVVFGGADLAGADLRGADLRGTSLAGAYIAGILMDGELVKTTPYAQEEISQIEETVYVEDVAKSKTAPVNEELRIGARRDFEETPPPLPPEVEKQAATRSEIESVEAVVEKEQANQTTEGVGEMQVDQVAPEPKTAPSLQPVRLSSDVQDLSATENETQVASNSSMGSEPAQVTTPAEQVNVPDGAEEEVVAVLEQSPKKQAASVVMDEPNPEAGGEAIVMEETEETPVPVASPVVPGEAEPGSSQPEQAARVDGSDDKSESETTLVAMQEEGAPPDVQKSELEEPALVSESPVQQNIEILLDENRCYGCNLEGADLSGRNLGEADLEGANLKGANLQGVDLEEANLKGSDLSGADLRHADLRRADLYKANLTKANLTDAKLEETLLDDADLTDVIGYQGTSMMMQDQ